MLRDNAVQLTPAGFAKLQEELRTLTEVKRADLAARVIEANDHGDVSDNGEVEGLKEELVMTDARIQELTYLLEHAEPAEPAGDGVVGLGSTVSIKDGDGEEETWKIVSHAEADTRDGTISTESPVGRQLFGKRAGESFSVSTPGGEVTYTVVSVG